MLTIELTDDELKQMIMLIESAQVPMSKAAEGAELFKKFKDASK